MPKFQRNRRCKVHWQDELTWNAPALNLLQKSSLGQTLSEQQFLSCRTEKAAQYLCPAIFPWVDRGPATEASGRYVMKMVGILYLLILIFDLIIVCGMGNMGTFTTILLFIFLFAIIGVLLAISRKPQNRSTMMFMTPGLPFVPAIAVTVNIYLIFKLSILTLLRFTVWMTLGFVMYFYYGIKNSTLEQKESDESGHHSENIGNIELKITEHQGASPSHRFVSGQDRSIYEGQQLDAFGQPVFGNTNFGGSPSHSTAASQSQKSSKPLFVAQDSFPTWDD
ncbi:hypothetical protein PV325_010678 [Microctonus aethiopoides]|nr:hypothetical protein PV325_010678 [Microctonus aethiopoides]